MTRCILDKADMFEHGDGPVLTGSIGQGMTRESLSGLVGAEVLVHQDGKVLRALVRSVHFTHSFGGVPLVGLQVSADGELEQGKGPWAVSLPA